MIDYRSSIQVLIFMAFLATATGFSSCYYDVEEDLYPDETCVTEGVTYQFDIQPIIDNNCNVCHNSVSRQGGIILEGYDNLSQYAANGRLLGVIKHQSGFSPMPKDQGKLPDCTIAQIEAWINAGYPNN